MSNYKAREREYIRSIEQMDLPSNMADDLRRYIQSMSFTLAASSRYQYLHNIVSFLNYLEDPTLEDLSRLKQRDFDDYLLYLQSYENEDGKREENANVSLKRKLSALRSFFDYLSRTYEDNEKLQMAFTNAEKVILPRLPKKRFITYMDQNEVKRFREEVATASSLSKRQQKVHAITKERDIALTDLMLSTGLRLSEIANLDVNDLDMENKNLICIRKGGFADKVFFSDQAAESLEKYLAVREHLLDEDSSPSDKKALFLSTRHKRMTDRTIRVMIEKYAGPAVPQKKITPHKLRATYATNLYTQTRDIHAVATALGHSSVNTTKEYYAHVDESIKQENRNKVFLP